MLLYNFNILLNHNADSILFFLSIFAVEIVPNKQLNIYFMSFTKSLDGFKIGAKKYHSSTKMVSVRLDSDLYEVAKTKNLNISLAVNVLLRGYLYIQNNDNECPLIGSSRFHGSELVVDVYFR